MQNVRSIEKEFYSQNLLEFAEAVVWFMKPERVLQYTDMFLLYMMRGTSEKQYLHAKKYFDYTDDDFRSALYNAPPGIIMHQEVWDYWNKHLNINPILPMPKKKFFSQMTPEELEKTKNWF